MSEAIPRFPLMTPLRGVALTSYAAKFGDTAPISDLSPNNLLVWFDDEIAPVLVGRLAGGLVVEVAGSLLAGHEKSGWVSITGDEVSASDLLQVIASAERAGKSVQMISGSIVGRLRCDGRLRFSEQHGDFDYVLSTLHLAELRGSSLAAFRGRVRRFQRRHGETIKVEVHAVRDLGMKLVKVLDEWSQIRSFGPNGNDPTRIDKRALERLVNNQWQMPYPHQVMTFAIDGQLAGFSVFHKISRRWAIGNHVKWDEKYAGICDVMAYELAMHLRNEGVECVNIEQDMGIPGIAAYKRSLAPVDYLRRYSARRR